MRKCFNLSMIATMLVCIASLGCGNNNLGKVSGTVTLDGQPLEGAMVIFTPKAGGRPAGAETDASGEYVLTYDRESSGAMLGEHIVEITTYSELANDDDTVNVTEERVPAKYNFDTELTANVTEGSNVFDFDLKSEGEIIQGEDALPEDDG